ncbi:hypothetical protein F383_09164 [Gossypium arboreum]|uniref:Uncharacterized protein n=1 Tax=Gossypium arboreum TaxID=29729 RepID=A0A0B0PPI8_GOSAR|nr:hypothetical protein F383_23604 [Gossypium arboreum]KHG26344.1 hypothetical protein F383_09164 [Gossypium arboreum]
MCCKKGFSPEE